MLMLHLLFYNIRQLIKIVLAKLIWSKIQKVVTLKVN